MPDEPLLSLKDYLDAQVAEVRRAVEVAKDVPPPEAVPLREHIEAVLDEQRRAMGTAQEEREKAAQALRVELARSIQDGDQNLREHIAQQVMQIQAALESAEKLEVQRFEALKEQLKLITSAAAEAIAKAEAATEKQFASVNEWRGQSADRERSQQEQTAKLTSSFMPRELAEAQFADLRRAVAEISEKMGKVV